jgi:hypothetical protein
VGARFTSRRDGLRVNCFSSFMRDGHGGGNGAVVAFSKHIDHVDVDNIQQSFNIAFRLEGHFTEQRVPQSR